MAHNKQITTGFVFSSRCLVPITLTITLLTGCASNPPASLTTPDKNIPAITECRALYQHFNEAVLQHNVKDSQTHAIDHLPYLHVNRFLASFSATPDDKLKTEAWLDQLQMLALQTHSIEFRNLPAEVKNSLLRYARDKRPSITGDDSQFTSYLDDCAQTLRQHELEDPAVLQHAYQFTVPSDYQTWQRVIGLYPLTVLPVAIGINSWHADSTALFKRDYEEIKSKGRLIRYLPDTTRAESLKPVAPDAIKQSTSNPLGLPALTRRELDSLFSMHAPVFEIDTVTDSDRPGAPILHDNRASVDISQPTLFTLLSYTWFKGRILPQLNYISWFPSRPCDSFFDILCGHMDGIIWRVTLNHDGRPIHYDTVHNCGCYHTFFPTAALAKKESPYLIDEWAFTPVTAPQLSDGERILLRLEPRTHHISSIQAIDQYETSTKYESQTYTMTGYNWLRSLPTDSKSTRSLFQNNGLVAGTERAERFILWPMGIPSPGAMRQWGHHATAFAGRRYFDDPCLLDNYYNYSAKGMNNTSTGQVPTHNNSQCAKPNP